MAKELYFIGKDLYKGLVRFLIFTHFNKEVTVGEYRYESVDQINIHTVEGLIRLCRYYQNIVNLNDSEEIGEVVEAVLRYSDAIYVPASVNCMHVRNVFLSFTRPVVGNGTRNRKYLVVTDKLEEILQRGGNDQDDNI